MHSRTAASQFPEKHPTAPAFASTANADVYIHRVQSLTTHKKPCAHTLFLSANITQASEAKFFVPEAKFGLGRRF